MALSLPAAAEVPAAQEGARRGVLAVTVAATFIAFLDVTIVNVAFPAIEASFSEVSRSTLSWILNAYNVVFAALLLPAGRIGDLLGHRRLFLGGVALFTLASAICAAAPSAELLIAARVLQAVGAAVLMPTALALLLSSFPPAQRPSAVAAAAAAAGVAAALGPSLGGLLVETLDWRVIFFANLPLGALILWEGRRRLPPLPPRAGRLPDLLGTVLVATGVGLIAFALVHGPDHGWDHAPVIASLALAPAALAGAVARSLRHPAPAFDLRRLRRARVGVANVATAVFAAGFFAKILCDVLFLTSVWGYSVLEAGLAMSPSPLITAVSAGAAGRMANRHGHRPVILAGGLLYAAGCGFYALFMSAEPAYATHFLPATVLTGVGIACALPMLTSAAVNALPPDEFGVGSGVNTTARQLGGVLGIAVLFAILGDAATAGRFHAGWAFIAATSLATALLSFRVAEPERP